jgi:hypothetical protein
VGYLCKLMQLTTPCVQFGQADDVYLILIAILRTTGGGGLSRLPG